MAKRNSTINGITQNLSEKTKDLDMNIENFAGEVAIGATRITLIAGAIALGATLLSGEKTRNKIAQETKGLFDNLKGIVNVIKDAEKQTLDAAKQLKG
jgi:hypothetical protein